MQRELAAHIQCSRTNLIRWASRSGVSLDAHSYKPHVVNAVCSFYEQHGKVKTQERFSDVSVRSIVERNYGRFKPRQIRWTDEQAIEAVKMAGLVSPFAQARYFNRPNANEGAIKSIWVKKFKSAPCSINGMNHWIAKELVTSNARYLQPIGRGRNGKPTKFRRVILWVDMENCLKREVPGFIKESIEALANFQRWLWKSKNPKPLILKMIKDRELRLEHAKQSAS